MLKATFPLLRSRGERSVSLFCASHGRVFLSGNVYNIPQELLVLAVIKVHFPPDFRANGGAENKQNSTKVLSCSKSFEKYK